MHHELLFQPGSSTDGLERDQSINESFYFYNPITTNMDIPFDLDTMKPSSIDMVKLQKTSKKAGESWKKIKDAKKTIKVIAASITKNPQGVRHVKKNFVEVHKQKKPQRRGKVIVRKADINRDITVQRKVFVSGKKKSSHPKLDKLLRGKHGK